MAMHDPLLRLTEALLAVQLIAGVGEDIDAAAQLQLAGRHVHHAAWRRWH